jgi:hypothetical protein
MLLIKAAMLSAGSGKLFPNTSKPCQSGCVGLLIVESASKDEVELRPA